MIHHYTSNFSREQFELIREDLENGVFPLSNLAKNKREWHKSSRKSA